ncbi:glucose-6-phosphate isomerase [Bradyrhizobium sp. LHD-71]|uniref:glucose-6-phosphate isomerase n=1 Tax=Bradyrhizobium sp. LHD-71 TaxID=3072141 RepID=UPI00280EDC1F|nr:glucose-6-phosphate isomerase [Bradyrhizobium sp. LHD-71]MDQ8726841.1 glucose-6-phosphate isomerase [Bradyrhizobium sp. LHD-71]
MPDAAKSSTSLVQSIELARAERVGPRGVTTKDFDAMLKRTEPALDWLRAGYANGSLPHLKIPEERGDLPAIEGAAKRLRDGASDIVFLGVGGSSLGGQTLLQLADFNIPGLSALRDKPRLHFLDNLDPRTFAEMLGKLPLATTKFVAISKSGGTGETLMQTMAVLDAIKSAGLEAKIPDLMLGLSEPAKAGGKNGLRSMLEHFKVPMLDHHTGIGGRFSVLTNVGLLPAAVAGLNITAIRAGAARAVAPVLAKTPAADVLPAVGAALSIALAATGKSITVLMPYADRLAWFGKWYVQLWAESLGKDGKGTTPLAALGPVDQHSQLQLFIAGPRDKLFTIVTVGTKGKGPRMPKDLAKLCGEDALGGKTIGDLVAAQGRATAETLAKNGCPVRTFHMDIVDEVTMGEFLMHYMLETMIAAQLLGIDAFDQPAVEEGKILAKRYIAED